MNNTKNSKLNSYKRLLSYLWPYWKLLSYPWSS